MNEFLLGAAAMASAVIGLFFLRFWRRTRDRLFVIFAIAFWLMGLSWLLLALVGRDETYSYLYTLRLVAFILILLAIADKNWPARRRPDGGG